MVPNIWVVGHVIGWDEAKVTDTETDKYKRWVREAMEIRKGGTDAQWKFAEQNINFQLQDIC